MNKQQMIKWLKGECKAWGDVKKLAIENSKLGDWLKIEGWFISYDGPSIEEMYLTNAHPMSDQSGDVITNDDFNQGK